jgi:GNAT superfamily N-acetyltransferase
MEASSTKSSSGMDLRVISLSETTEEAFLQKCKAEATALFDACRKHDGIDFATRHDLSKLFAPEFFEDSKVIVSLADEKLVGVLICYNACQSDAFVHPDYRRKHVFAAMLEQQRSLMDISDIPFDICDKSESGVACAKHLGLVNRQTDNDNDQYMKIEQLSEVTKELPKIRAEKASNEHVDLLVSIWLEDQQYLSPEEYKKLVLDDLKTDFETWLYFNDANEHVAFVVVSCEENEEAFIRNIIVRPRYRRQGYGEAIMRHNVAYWLNERKKKYVELMATSNASSKLYLKCGFYVTASYSIWGWPDKSSQNK